jgi:polyphosphate kinase
VAKKTKRKKRTEAESVDLNGSGLYLNRELSWLEFNDRVLREGLSHDLPPLERLKFLAIVSSNLDEFFMIRVAGLKQQREARLRKRDIAGMTATQQLSAIAARVHRMVHEQSAGIRQVTHILGEKGVFLLEYEHLTAAQVAYADSYFSAEVLPVLTPLALDRLQPSPVLPGLRLMIALRVDEAGAEEEQIVVVPVPGGLPRFLVLPAEEGVHMVRLEQVIAANIHALLGEAKIRASVVFRLTRDADVAVQEDAAGDLLEAMEHAVRARQQRAPVRMEISARPDKRLRKWLMDWAGLAGQDVYEIDGMLDASTLMEVATRPGLDKLRDADWPPQPPRDLVHREENLWDALADGDVLLEHPYESFQPVVRLMDEAADDPEVLAIKQTLYRTSGDSPIIAALERAAGNGKQVVVLVELKARFDEARNIQWARRLEEAGALVIYGIAGYKTHSKALLIVRREAGRIRRYVHLATGNYNDRTAKLYSDIGLMTCDKDMANDTAAFFNLLTGQSESVGFSRLTIAPGGLRSRFLELIDREVKTSTKAEPGRIIAKVNSLHDKGIAKALYRASQAGVQVQLNVRGICCVRPGLPGVSENLEVISIVDRYLEHARIFYFRNAGHEEVYLSSADWMTRNLDKRLEILFPVLKPPLRRRLIETLETYFADNVKARRLRSDGTYESVPTVGEPVRAQQALYHRAVEASREGRAHARFRPLKRPEQ